MSVAMHDGSPDPRGRRPVWLGVALRLAGAALILLAWFAGAMLQARADHRPGGGAIDGALAAVAFLSASIAMGGLVMGGHLLDRVPIAARWRSSARDRRR